MSPFEIKSYGFDMDSVASLGSDSSEANWPVVYQIYNSTDLYIGETTSLKNRMNQHIKSSDKEDLSKFSVVYDNSFNKSAALDLESQLIQWFVGDGKYVMRNKNDGLVDHDYFQRSKYRKQFEAIWDRLRELHIADRSITDIENSGLFKFSPYKRLSQDQLRVVQDVLIDIESNLKYGESSISIIGGSEGTGKTIVLMYLVKLIRDIQDATERYNSDEEANEEFSLFFQEPFRNRFQNKSIAFVVPNQSLKGSIERVLKSISNLKSSVDLLSPIEFGSNGKTYDITFVDEAHLLKSGNQEVHKRNRQKVDDINAALFTDGKQHSELDWIVAKSQHVVMVYGDQRIRPNNIDSANLDIYKSRQHILKSQMRSKGGTLYIEYLKNILSNTPPVKREEFKEFEFKLINSFSEFVSAIRLKDESDGLSRIVAGFAWDWKSNKKINGNIDDIIIDGIGLKWNSTQSDWVGSKKSLNEVGSIYTIQGYDLNYCGVIIGNDLAYDSVTKQLVLNRKNYYDRGAKKRTKQQIEAGIELTDSELLDQVIRTYRILMNRSIKGTYVYVCNPELRDYLSKFIAVK